MNMVTFKRNIIHNITYTRSIILYNKNMDGRTNYTTFFDNSKKSSRPRIVSTDPSVFGNDRPTRPARGRGAGPRVRQQREPVSREDVVNPVLRPTPSPTPRWRNMQSLDEVYADIRELEQKSVGSALDNVTGGRGYFSYDRANNEKLIQALVQNYGASPLHAKKILQFFSTVERPGREVKKMSPSDYVNFLVRFHPLVHEDERPIPGNRSAANRGYKISEIYELLYQTPFWFFVSPGKEADVEALYNWSLKRHPGAIIGRESSTESHTIVFGWYQEDTDTTTETTFVRKFINGDPIKGQALYYKQTDDLPLRRESFRTIQEAARAVAKSEGLVFLPDSGARKVGAASFV